MTLASARDRSRLETGIVGFDALCDGGLPAGRVSLLVGGPGTGKTVFALQTLSNAARRGQRSIYVSFEESPGDILAIARLFEWGSHKAIAGKVRPLDGNQVTDSIAAGAADLSAMLSALEVQLRALRATWVVFDGLDSLLALLTDPTAERREIHRLRRWLSRVGVGCIITAKEMPGGQLVDIGQADGLLAFSADCVVRLGVQVQNHLLERTLRVVKYRGNAVKNGEIPFILGSRGVVVGYESRKPVAALSRERVSTGVERLDTLLSGGYLRGSHVLITGLPGTAKTTLAAGFALASVRRGERTLMFLFDEQVPHVQRNLQSVGYDFSKAIRTGLLQMESLSASTKSAESHFVHILEKVDSFAPRNLVIDPISALTKAGALGNIQSVAERLLERFRVRGITGLFTSLLSGVSEQEESSRVGVSTIADTWMHLTYAVHAGERNRTLSVIKARGTGHSNQVRELIIDSDGVHLTDVYVDGGDTLMGTARVARQGELRAQESERQRALAERMRELQIAVDEGAESMRAIKREIRAKREALMRLAAEERREVAAADRQRQAVGRSRFADRESKGGIAVRAPKRA